MISSTQVAGSARIIRFSARRSMVSWPFDHRVRPPEVHLLECLNKRISRSADGVFGTACDEDVAKQGDIAFAFSCLSACLPIHLQARCDLVEARRRPNQPGVSKARGAANRRLCPGAKPDRRSRPLHRPRRHRDIVHLIILSAVSDILFRPEAVKKRSALLQSTAALLDGLTERREFLRSVPGAYP